MSTPSPWENFTMEELTCSCGCGQMKMQADYMEKAVKLRKFYGKTVRVHGYRCPEHDAKVGTSGTPGSGPHTQGRALDWDLDGVDAMDLLAKALKLELFTGFGLNQKGEGRFIHIDDIENAPEHPRPFLWTY